MYGDWLWSTGLPITTYWPMSVGRCRTDGRLEAVFAREAEARRDHELIGFLPHRGAEASERRSRHDDRDRAPVEDLLPRRTRHLGLEHASLGIDRDVHRQLAVQLPALVLRKIAGAALLDLAAQLVVVHRIDGLARRRPDHALLGACVLFLDALLDLGEQLHQLPAALLLGSL